MFELSSDQKCLGRIAGIRRMAGSLRREANGRKGKIAVRGYVRQWKFGAW
jgi:hypothetical protein